MPQSVVAVSSSPDHSFSKPNLAAVRLIAGIGVEGDAHSGELVKHRYLVKRDPTQPNLNQIHLINQELFDAVAERGYTVTPGQLGENITTLGVDLISLPTATVLRIGAEATVELTGLRNPCPQIDGFQDGLLSHLIYRKDGKTVRNCGVMGIVLTGGEVLPGDSITIDLPPVPHRPLRYIVNAHKPHEAAGRDS